MRHSGLGRAQNFIEVRLQITIIMIIAVNLNFAMLVDFKLPITIIGIIMGSYSYYLQCFINFVAKQKTTTGY